MVGTKGSRSQQIRSKLPHPIVDADGHMLELTPVLSDYVYQVGGADARDLFDRTMVGAAETGNAATVGGKTWFEMSLEEKKESWFPAPPWWAMPTRSALDRATATVPRVLNDRMDELGMDYAVLYTTTGLAFDLIEPQEQKLIVVRAINAYAADIYRPYAYRMTPAAIVPMDTPEIAIREMEYAVNELGMKAIMLPGRVERPIGKYRDEYPGSEEFIRKMDVIGIDSDYDYDPFWKRCQELKIVPASHGSDAGWGAISVTNYVFNHLSSFAYAHETFCKALFLGGVTRRFPGLNFMFLEGGVGWACNLYSDLIGHWEKRNGKMIGRLDPSKLDLELAMELAREYAEGRIAEHLAEVRDNFAAPRPTPPDVDDWRHVPMESIEEMGELFTEPFYFGCEADDPMNAWAFDSRVNPLEAKLKAVFSSDIGHWDVPDMREVVEEAYEMLEHELMTEEDFRAFVFENVVRMYGEVNPDFFKGTAVEKEAEGVLNG